MDLRPCSDTNLSTVTEAAASDFLTDYSPSDAPWDRHRSEADDVQRIYAQAEAFERYAQRISLCSGVLRFAREDDADTGESRFRLRHAAFCRVRHCPVCQWRRSLMWQARFWQALPALLEAHPKARWLFLTLTVRNCRIEELGDALTAMYRGWQRMVKRPEMRPVLGWIRTVEVTRGGDGSAHPHLHVLLMVPSSMVSGKYYVTQARWTHMWQECMRLDYTPIVDIRAVRPRAKDGTGTDSVLRGAVAETLKYATKPSDMTADDQWFLELTRQTHKRRFVAAGGVLKDVLRVDQESDTDLALIDENGESSDGPMIAFSWHRPVRRYRRDPKNDKARSEKRQKLTRLTH